MRTDLIKESDSICQIKFDRARRAEYTGKCFRIRKREEEEQGVQVGI